MFKHLWMIILVMLAILPAQVRAINTSATVSDGTMGFGLHWAIPVLDSLNVRIGANHYTFALSSLTTTIAYDYRIHFKSLELLADWYPFSNPIRLTAGIAYNQNKITTSTGFVGESYIPGTPIYLRDVGKIKGNITFNRFAPYLGIGYGNALQQSDRWTFSGDLGYLFQGEPSVTLRNVDCMLDIYCEPLVAHLMVENQNLAQGFNKFKRYPIIRIGISYRF